MSKKKSPTPVSTSKPKSSASKKSPAALKLRSQAWFDNPANTDMTALYLERTMNYGLGLEELQSGRPIIGIAQTGSDIAPCNRHHLVLAERVREGIRDAGGIAFEFPIHPIQETCKRPTASLDRNLQYLSLVEILYGYPLDGVVLTTGCDKTTPAQLMAAATVDIPAIALNSGPMLNGWYKGERTGSGTIVWKARELLAAGEIDETGFLKLVASSAPSTGHCNTMGTASTMNSLTEALGMTLPGSAAIPAPYRDRQEMAYLTGKRIVEMVRENLKPSDILTRAAFENAIVVNSAIGGSTNAPIHLNAIARHIGVPLTTGDWEKHGYKIPLLVNLQPAGEYLGEDYYRAGGVPAVVAELIAKGKIQPALTANGKSIIENCEGRFTEDRKVIFPYAKPMMKNAGFLDFSGNLFDSAIMKTSVITPEFHNRYLEDPADPMAFEGTAVVFDGPEDYHRRIDDPKMKIDAHSILFMRGVGPRRLPGRGRGREHAGAGLPAEEGRHRAALHRRWTAVGHLGLAIDPECVARSRDRRCAGVAQDRRPRAHRPEEAHGEHAGVRRRAGQAPPEARSRRRLPVPAEPDAVAGDPALGGGRALRGHGAQAGDQVPEDPRHLRRAAR
jgi:dihydroxy-acid dehydratase